MLQNIFNGLVCAFPWNAPHSDLCGMFTALHNIILSDNSQYPHLNKQIQDVLTWQVKGALAGMENTEEWEGMQYFLNKTLWV